MTKTEMEMGVPIRSGEFDALKIGQRLDQLERAIFQIQHVLQDLHLGVSPFCATDKEWNLSNIVDAMHKAREEMKKKDNI